MDRKTDKDKIIERVERRMKIDLYRVGTKKDKGTIKVEKIDVDLTVMYKMEKYG